MKITEVLGLVALALILLRIYCLLRQGRKSAPQARGAAGNSHQIPRYRVGPAGPTQITVEQLTADRKTVYARYDVTIIPGEGVSIGRKKVPGCVIILREGMDCTKTVGAAHARLGHDSKGFFLQNCGDGHKIGTGEGLAEQVDVRDGTLVWLGQQPIRFRIPSEK